MNTHPSVNESLDVVACELRVGGMDCASCAATIEKALRRIDGVGTVDVDVVGGRVRVAYLGGDAVRSDFATAIRRAGFDVTDPDEGGAPAQAHNFWTRRGRSVMTIASGFALALGLLLDFVGAPAPVPLILLAIASVTGGWYVVPRGIRAALSRSLDMNFLMTVAAAGAWLIGEPEEAAATLFLFAVAALLESHSMDRARNAIRALMDLSPAEATVRRNGTEMRVPVADIAIGETVIVRPGEKLAVDGDVMAGRSSVNQASITGESMPVDREPGESVFAGSLNGQGALEVRSTKRASDTTLARIIHAVEEAQASRAPSQTFVDRFARVYTPSVVAIAVLIAIVPPLAGLGTWETWIYRSLAMLVIACPCALVISTPVSIVSGLAGAARAGVLIKGGAHLENLGSVTVLAIDKTGTLTTGRAEVVDIVPFTGTSRAELLAIAAAVERHSEHPLARAVMEHARQSGIDGHAAADFHALGGRGARAMVSTARGKIETWVANARLAEELGASTPDVQQAMSRIEEAGRTAVVVLERESSMQPAQHDTGRPVVRALGVIAIADQPRAEAAEALLALHSVGIRRIIMVTGDNRGAARAIGAAIGVDEVHAEMLPDDKVRVVRDLEAAGTRVAFVGDGINDAPALAASTVGVAMGAAATDVALETADVALMGDDLRLLASAVRRSRRTVGIIKQNIAFSLAVKAVFLVLAVGGYATLWMAVAADMGGSLLVVGNGLRARSLPRLPVAVPFRKPR